MNATLGVLLLCASFAVAPHAFAQAGPSSLNISGGLFQSNGTPVTASGVNFRLEVYDPSGTCLLYSEVHNSQDLSNTRGGFSLELGRGTSATNLIDAGNPTSLSWKVFQNTGAPVGPWAGCPAPVTMNAGDERVIRVSYDLGGGYVAMTPDVPIASSAYAMVAETLQGKKPTDFIQVKDDGATVSLSQSNIENIFSFTNYPKLDALVNGTSTQYMVSNPSAAVGFNNQRITNVGTPSAAGDAATKGYADGYMGGKAIDLQDVAAGTGGGKVLMWDSAQNKWVAQTPAGDSTKLPLAGGTMSGAIDMNGNNILNAGDVKLSAQKTLYLGTFDNAQEGVLVGTLDNTKKGATWYNSQTNELKVWNGTSAVVQAYLTAGKISASWIPDAIGAGAGTYGSATQVPQFTVGADGRITAASNVTISGVSPGGAAGGDLSGTYPNPSIANSAVTTVKINDAAVTPVKLVSGVNVVNRMFLSDGITGSTFVEKICAQDEVLKYNVVGGWACETVTNLSPVKQVEGRTGNVDIDLADIQSAGTAAARNVGTGVGDVVTVQAGGKLPAVDGSDLTNVNAVKLQGRDVANTAPNDTEVLMWDNTASKWKPAAIPSAPVYTATNVGSAGTGVFKQKNVNDFEFKKLNAASTKVSITDDVANSKIDIDVNVANLFAGGSAGQMLQSTGATAPAWSTAVYPSTTTANQLLYSSANNTVAGLATANNSVLMTDGSGVPTWSAASGDLFGQYALLAGRAGGQNLRGGTAASENLTLESTANATKGYVLLQPNGGNVGIGTTTPGSPLDVNTTSSSTAAAPTYSATFFMNGDPSGAAASTDFLAARLDARSAATNANNIREISGSRILGYHQGTGAVTRVIGSNDQAIATAGSGTISDMIGTWAISNRQSTANVTRARGVYALVQNSGAAGTLGEAVAVEALVQGGAASTTTDAYGVRVDLIPTGTVTNYYGVYVNSETGANRYALYTAGSTPSYFGGNVGIGTTSPGQLLHVNGVMRLEPTALPAGAAGDIVIDSGATNGLKFHNGTSWVTVATSATAGESNTASNQGAGGVSLVLPKSGVDLPFKSIAAASTKVSVTDNAGAKQVDIDVNEANLSLGNIGGTLPLSKGGTNANITAANGGVVYSTATAMAVTAAGSAGQMLQSNGAAAPTWSTAAYPSSTTANQLLYSSANNTVTGLATANNSILTTDGSGVPSWSAASGDVFSQYALLAGRAGGQNLRGGTAAGENLNLDSTANASKGNIIMNSGGGNVAIGTTTASNLLTVEGGTNGAIAASVKNTTVGTSAFGGYLAQSDVTSASLYASSSGTTGNYGTVSRTSAVILRANTGATKMLVGTGPAVPFYLMTGDTPRVTIDGTGNVGIGLTNPARLLDVAGPIRVGAAALPGTPGAGDIAIDSADGNKLKWYNGSGWQTVGTSSSTGDVNNGGNSFAGPMTIGTNDANTLNLETGGTTRLTVDTSGNVGIGTTSPSATLQVAGQGATLDQLLTVYNDTTIPSLKLQKARNTMALPAIVQSGDTVLRIQGEGYDGASFRSAGFIRVNIDGTPGASDMPGRLTFGTTPDGASSAIERMRIDSAGNVGIGSTAPLFGIHVESNNGSGYAGLFRKDSTSSGLLVGTHNTSGKAMLQGIQTNMSTADDLMLNPAGGNVGIGTSTAGSKLTVAGTANISGATTIGTAVADGSTILTLQDASTNSLSFSRNKISTGTSLTVGSSGTNAMNLMTNNTNRLVITSTGEVGIGQTTPARVLHVGGPMRLDAAALPGTPGTGDIAIDSADANKLKWYNGSGWQTVGTSSATGDLNNGGNNGAVVIGSNDNTLSLEANNATAVTVLGNGNVGIGTTTTLGRLDVRAASGSNASLIVRNNDFAAGSAGSGAAFATTASSGNTSFEIQSYSAGVVGGTLALNASGGSVGIGTTAPAEKLDVNGKIHGWNFYSGYGSVNDPAFAPTGGMGMWAANSGADLAFSTNSLERIRVLNNGNVGIGTTNPSTKLDVAGAINGSSLQAYNTASAAYVNLVGPAADPYTYSYVKLSNTANTKNWSVNYLNGSTVGADADKMQFTYYNGTTYTPYMTVNPTGELGVGVTSPARLLHVNGAMRVQPAALPGTPAAGDIAVDSGAANTLKFHNGTSWVSVSNGDFLKDGSVAMTGNLKLNNNWLSNDGGNEGIRVDNSGNVSVGTASNYGTLLSVAGWGSFFSVGGAPGVQLMRGNAALTAGDQVGVVNFRGHDGTSTIASAQITSYVTPGSSVATGSVPQDLVFGAGTTTATERMRITSAGNVGIGTTNPLQKLDVNGAIRAGSGSSPTGSILLLDNYSSGSLTTLGTGYSSGGPVIGYGVTPSTATADAFVSSTPSALPRSAIVSSDSVRFFTGASQTVATGSAVTMAEAMRIENNGKVGIGTTNPGRLLHVNGPMRVEPAALPGTPAAGDVAVDSGDANKLKWYNGSGWQTVGTSSATGDINNGGNNGAITIGSNDNTLSLEAGNSTAMTISTIGHIGVNVAPTTASRFFVQTVDTDTANGYNNLNTRLNISPTATVTTSTFKTASRATAEVLTNQNMASLPIYAQVLSAKNSNVLSGNTIQQLTGLYVEPMNANTGTVSLSQGAQFDIFNNGGGTITAAKGINTGINNSSGTVGAAYGLYTFVNNSGTMTNTYGLYIDDITSGTQTNQAYGIYQQDANARNYFAGNLGVGTTSPGRLLDVAGAVRVQPSGVPGSPAAGDIYVDSGDANKLKWYNGSGWQTVGTSSGLVNFTESLVSSGLNASVPVAVFQAANGAGNVDMVLSPKGTGSIAMQVADGTVTGGNKRGVGAVDFQTNRSNNTEVASGGYSAIIGGSSNTASGGNSAAVAGLQITASGSYSAAIAGRNSNASGDFSLVSGSFVTAPAYNQVTFGRYNATSGSENATSWVNTDPLFVIGNGSSAAAKANAVTVLKNGQVGIGTTSPGRLLDVAGAVRVQPSGVPASPAAGDMYVDSGDANKLKWYNGSGWQTVGSGTPGGANTQVQFNNSGAFAGSSNFVWDNTNSRLGINTSPAAAVHIENSTNFDPSANIVGGLRLSGAYGGGIIFKETGNSAGIWTNDNGASLHLAAAGNNTTGWGSTTGQLVIKSGNVGVGVGSPGRLLHVNGAIRVAPSGVPATPAAGDIYIDSGSSNALKFHNGTSWVTVGSAGAALISGLQAATAVNTIDNAAYAQTWNWNSLTTQNALSLGSSTMTTGSLLNLTSSFNSATSTGNILNVSSTGSSSANVGVNVTHQGGNAGAVGVNVNMADASAATANTGLKVIAAGGNATGASISMSAGGGASTPTGLAIAAAAGGATGANIVLTNNNASNNTVGMKIDVASGGASTYGAQITLSNASGNGRAVNVSAAGSADGIYSSVGAGRAGYFKSTSGYGLIVESGNVGLGTTAPSAKLTVSENATALNATPGTLLHIAAADDSHTRLTMDAYGPSATTYNSIYMRRTRGTENAPSATQNGDVLGILSASGYGATAMASSARAVIGFNAAQTWTDAAQGAYINFQTTPTGSTSITDRMRLHADGGMRLLPSALPGTPAAGDIAIDSGASNTLKFHNGTAWVTVGSGGGSPAGSADGRVQFKSGSSFAADDEFHWDNTNKRLGIGTTAPTTKLDVNGTINLSSGSLVSWGTWDYIRADASSHFLAFATATNERMRIDNNGAIGMGTTTPGAGLDVQITQLAASGNAYGTRLQQTINAAANNDVLTALYVKPSFNDQSKLAVAHRGLVVESATTTTEALGNFFQPSLSSGQDTLMLLGRSAVTNDSAFIGYMHNTTQANRALEFGHYGAGAQMTLLNGGNFGIGTTAPARLLHVNGPIRVQPAALPGTPAAGDIAIDSGASNALKFHNGTSWVTVGSGTVTPAGADGNIQYNNNGALGGTANLHFDATNNRLGVGTNVPAGIFHGHDAAGTGTTVGLQLTVPNLANGNKVNMIFGKSATSSGSGVMSYVPNATAANNRIEFSHYGTSPLMIIQENGNVGIGTTSPGSKLEVSGGDLTVNGTQSIVGINTLIRMNTSTAADPTYRWNGGGNMGMFTPGSNIVAFSTTSTERMRIDASGNVGIGTTSPGQALHVAVGNANAARIDINSTLTAPNQIANLILINLDGSSANSYSSLLFRHNDSSSATFSAASIDGIATNVTSGSEAGALRFSTRTNAATFSEKMRIDKDGNVGIGITNPNVALDVSGDIEYTGTITDVSDERLKENIQPIGSGIEMIRQLPVYSYTMKADEKKRTEYGVIAQDLQKLVPNLVSVIDKEHGYIGVNYIGLIPWSIRAIQEVDRDVAALKQENVVLKSRLDKLEEQNKVLAEQVQKLIELQEKKNAQ